MTMCRPDEMSEMERRFEALVEAGMRRARATPSRTRMSPSGKVAPYPGPTDGAVAWAVSCYGRGWILLMTLIGKRPACAKVPRIVVQVVRQGRDTPEGLVLNLGNVGSRGGCHGSKSEGLLRIAFQ